MNFPVSIKWLLEIFLIAYPTSLFAQGTIVSGTVTDTRTKMPVPMASVAFSGKGIGVNTNDQGNFTLKSMNAFTQITVSAIGYKTARFEVAPGIEQVINIRLVPDADKLSEVVVRSGKKKKYSNKNNPAVDLIRQVIAHKSQNRPESYSYTEYRKYERMIVSLGNLSDSFRNKRMFKKYQFLFREQDSSAIGGKTLLPLYMEEKLSDNYYRRSPYANKQIIRADKQVKYDENFIDNKGLSAYLNFMYQDINIYDNNILLMTNQLLSPIANSAPAFYKFFIRDTIKDQTPQLIELGFWPRNNTDLLFEGVLYITMDSNYAVQGAVLSVDKKINLNFVRQLEIRLTFDKSNDDKYKLSQSDAKMDFGLNKNRGGGIFGERLVKLDSFVVGRQRPKEIYEGPALVTLPDAQEKDTGYWSSHRPDTLDKDTSLVYKNIDSLQKVPSFRRAMDIATILLVGYKNTGPFEIGPLNAFYSFNPVEGFRPRLGGRTTAALSRRYYFETYVAYGTRDDKFKYFLSGAYSINNKSIYTFPQHFVRASFQHDTKIPGLELQFVQENNFLLSFKRGVNDQLLYNDIFRLDYIHEWENHFSYSLGLKWWDQHPGGSLYFQKLANDLPATVSGIQTTELSLGLRYAPHEKFYQGKLYRTPITDKYPVMTLRYNQGIQGLLGGEYTYQHIAININKRFYLSQLGYTDVTVEGAYLFGKVPYPLLDIHRANQTYSFQLQSYNLMNFLEFVSDHYASINIDHHFNGFLFNKVPLLKRLKWREIINVKALWGGIRNENNPAYDPSLLRFPVNAGGVPTTYSLNNGPYVEGSVGIGNIFKLVRVDLVRRFTYLEHPNAPQWGVRTLIKIDF